MLLRYGYRGENGGLTASFATIVSLNTKKRKIMLILCIHTSQSLITTPLTLSHVTVHNSTALQQN